MKNKIKNLTAVVVAIMMVFAVTACTGSKKEGTSDSTTASSIAEKTTIESTIAQTSTVEAAITQYPYIAKDTKGKEVVIESEPQRIISVAPSITELVFALGKGSELVGRTDYCVYPEEVSQIQSIGSLRDPNIETILELKPDVLIAATHFKEDVAQKLEGLGIKVIVLYNAEEFDGVYNTINTLGELFNAQAKAGDLIASMKEKVASVEEKVKGKEKPKVYYVVGFGKSGDHTATGDTFIGQILLMAGGDNVAKDGTGWKYSLEKIIEDDPEYIILSKNYEMKKQFEETEGYKSLSAVKNNKLIEIDDDLLVIQGPRLADGVEELAKILHSDLFK